MHCTGPGLEMNISKLPNLVLGHWLQLVPNHYHLGEKEDKKNVIDCDSHLCHSNRKLTV